MLYDLRNYTGQGKPNFSEWCEKMAEKLFADNGGNPGKLNIQQKQLLSSLNKNRFNIVKSPRNMGVTSLMLINTAYNVLYREVDNNEDLKYKNTPYSELYLYNATEPAIDALERFEKILHLCDEPIFLLEKNTSRIKVKFGERVSTVEFIPNGRLKQGVENCDSINIDNAAFVSDREMENIPNLSLMYNCKVTIASTPLKENGFFYELWQETLYGRGCFHPTSLKWYLDDRFNKNLKGTEGLLNYTADNIGMMFEALEHGEYLTNQWYEETKAALPDSWTNEVDGDFADSFPERF